MTPESYRDTGRAGDLVPEPFIPEPTLRPLHAPPDREPRWQYVLQASDIGIRLRTSEHILLIS